MNVLHLASKYGRLEMVDHLLEQGLDPQGYNEKTGFNMLHYACWYCEARLVEHILDSKLIPVDSLTLDGRNALQVCASAGGSHRQTQAF